MVDEEAHVMTDSSTVLKGALVARHHDQVNHIAKEYARYEDGVCISTNTIEGYFATLNVGSMGYIITSASSIFTAILASSISVITLAR